jgi:hypothetical protein
MEKVMIVDDKKNNDLETYRKIATAFNDNINLCDDLDFSKSGDIVHHYEKREKNNSLPTHSMVKKIQKAQAQAEKYK